MNFGYYNILIIYALVFGLHLLIPSRITEGYVCNNEGVVLLYRLNGLIVSVVTCLMFHFISSDDFKISLYDNYLQAFGLVNVLGILVSCYFVFWRQPVVIEKFSRCVTTDQIEVEERTGRVEVRKDLKLGDPSVGLGARFFLGNEWNPRVLKPLLLPDMQRHQNHQHRELSAETRKPVTLAARDGAGVDVKMFLYLVGAVGLQCVVLSCAYKQLALHGRCSRAMQVYMGGFAWFTLEYLLLEEVHLYTYDIFAEKIGFKLCWGCLAFYPFVYAVGAFPLVVSPLENDISSSTAGAIAVLFVVGWIVTRGSNLQKYYSKRDPTATSFLFGLVPQTKLPGTHLLVSGWWGVARHFNYTGEILQALALALPGLLVGVSVADRALALMYPLYYVLLFVPRQYDDEAVCRVKYGDKWDEYVERVPWRMCPGVF